jgi:hypothetical protein
MVGMHLGTIRQGNELISDWFKPFVGMIFVSVVITFSSGLSAQESTLPRPDEVMVFGSEDRSATLHSFSSNVLEHLQNSAYQEAFNGLDKMTPAASLVATGEVVIEDFHPTDIYEKYNHYSDILSMKIMAETLIIRSMMVKSGSLVS